MASVTTNYGFDVPTSSDLVKNGATQIALLGQDLDTFLFRPFSRNAVLNSQFNVWQRGTSFTVASSTTTYTADRFQAFRGATGLTVTRQSSSLTGIQYCARIARDSGNTSTTQIRYDYSFESADSYRLAGQTVTFSFYARAGANFSAASSVMQSFILTGTGTDQNILSGFTGSAFPAGLTNNATLTTSWQRFTYTGTIASTATQIGMEFNYTPTGTAGANDYFEVTGVMLEIGSQASPYAPATPTYQAELAACQRYYYRTTAGTTTADFAQGLVTSVTNVNALLQLPVTMRPAAVTIDYPAMSNFIVSDGTSIANPTSITLSQASTNVLSLSVVYLGFVIGRIGKLYANGTTNAYIGVSAEL